MAPFVLFGPAHLAAIALTLGMAAALSVWARGRPTRARRVSVGLAVFLLALAAFTIAWRAHLGVLRTEDVVPLQLCDFLILVAAAALLSRWQAAYELLYFWAFTGTFLAMITPAVSMGPPNWHFFTYFGLHGGVVVAAVFLTWGEGLRPARGAVWRAFFATNAYAVFVGVMNLILDENFLFLCEKPAQKTLLDAFGPWPVYILVADVFALGCFALLSLPFRRGRLDAA